MENHSPSQDDKLEGPSRKVVMKKNSVSFFNLLPQAFEANTDGIQSGYDVAAVNRHNSSANFRFRRFGSGSFKTAFEAHSVHQSAAGDNYKIGHHNI